MAGMRCGAALFAGESQLDPASPRWGGGLHVRCFYGVFILQKRRFVEPQTFVFQIVSAP